MAGDEPPAVGRNGDGLRVVAGIVLPAAGDNFLNEMAGAVFIQREGRNASFTIAVVGDEYRG